jgi:hypothetical protein
MKITSELAKHSHPLTVDSSVLYNIVNGKVAQDEVNVADALQIGEQMTASFKNSLPSGFHARIPMQVKTMEKLKLGMKVGEKTAFDLETIFLRLLMLGQQRQLQLDEVFQFELCAVPSSLIDEYGCLRKGNKAVLVKRLAVFLQNAASPDVVIVDAQQLLYHIVWPHGGDASVLGDSIKQRLSRYPDKSQKVLVFDKYDENSAKDHERLRRAGEGSVTYSLTNTSPFQREMPS